MGSSRDSQSRAFYFNHFNKAGLFQRSRDMRRHRFSPERLLEFRERGSPQERDCKELRIPAFMKDVKELIRPQCLWEHSENALDARRNWLKLKRKVKWIRRRMVTDSEYTEQAA